MTGHGDLRKLVATACRVLANEGLVRDITGHVSARAPGGQGMLIRCRGPAEYGLQRTTPAQVRLVDFDGGGDDAAGHAPPLELPIHGELYRSRPDVGAVVHAHPRSALLCGLAGITLRPIFGAFDPYALAIAARGVPVFPRSRLIDSRAVAGAMLDAMGDADVCLLRGHGSSPLGRPSRRQPSAH